ncbi:MAG: hypothetical protein KF782_10425 [Labilithrix sp.]|nr:hypothetical protein [Labilithrix sp.]
MIPDLFAPRRRLGDAATNDRVLALTALGWPSSSVAPASGLVHHLIAVRMPRRLTREALHSPRPRAEHEPQGDCYDNAVAESFSRLRAEHSTMKGISPPRAAAVASLTEHIDGFLQHRSPTLYPLRQPGSIELKRLTAQ